MDSILGVLPICLTFSTFMILYFDRNEEENFYHSIIFSWNVSAAALEAAITEADQTILAGGAVIVAAVTVIVVRRWWRILWWAAVA